MNSEFECERNKQQKKYINRVIKSIYIYIKQLKEKIFFELILKLSTIGTVNGKKQHQQEILFGNKRNPADTNSSSNTIKMLC